MDNLSHTIAGIALAEGVLQARTKSPGARNRLKRLFWGTSIVASNFPDLDFLIAPATKGKLGYLLHHRGFTHTLTMAFPEALFILGCVWLWLRARGKKLRTSDWGRLGALAIAAVWLHIAMDGMNNYGVHPFWPLSDRWYYGDFMFILEPWLWVCLIPPLLLSEKSRALRVALALVFFGGLAAEWASPIATWYAALSVTVTGLAVWYLVIVRPPAERLYVGIGACLSVVLLFAGLSFHGRRVLEAKAAQDASGFKLVDVVLSPLPSNFLCWTLLTIETKGDEYRMRKGVFAALPGWLPASRCPIFRVGRGAAPLEEIHEASDPHLWWLGEYRASLSKLGELARAHCEIAALFRFARAPFVLEEKDGFLAGDLRYDFSHSHSFAEIRVKREPEPCPEFVPPWTPPREQLLQER